MIHEMSVWIWVWIWVAGGLVTTLLWWWGREHTVPHRVAYRRVFRAPAPGPNWEKIYIITEVPHTPDLYAMTLKVDGWRFSTYRYPDMWFDQHHRDRWIAELKRQGFVELDTDTEN